MSLAQLEQQINLATRAMEQANLNGNEKLKEDIKDELAAFQKVLEKSKTRLKELEAIQKKCEDLSACRETDERRLEEAELSTEVRLLFVASCGLTRQYSSRFLACHNPH